jgi:hypothetical protein
MSIKTLTTNYIGRCALAVLSTILLLLLSCKRSNDTTPPDITDKSEIITVTPENTNSHLESPIEKPDLTDMSDEELLNIISAFETCLTDENELVFDESSEIPTETLYVFFLNSLGDVFSKGYEYYESKWLKDDGYFHIPVDEITEQLARYFVDFNFEPTSLSNYDPVENAVITESITGFGGAIDSRVVEKAFSNGI